MNETTELHTKFPVLCPHCRKHSTWPPAFIGMLAAFAGGKGRPVYLTTYALSVWLGVSRQMASRLMEQGEEEGLVEAVSKGSNTYHKTELGTQVWSRWIRAGYTHTKTSSRHRRRRA